MSCDHIVGTIRNQGIAASAWNERVADFAERVHDFNTRGMWTQVEHPGWLSTHHFCSNCGAPLDFKAMGLAEYGEVFAAREAASAHWKAAFTAEVLKTLAGAFEAGRAAARAGQTTNPFSVNEPLRMAFHTGWSLESGSIERLPNAQELIESVRDGSVPIQLR